MQNYIIFNKYNKISITKTPSEIEKNPNDLLITCNSNNLIAKIPSNYGAFLIDGRQTAKIYFKAASIY